MTKILNILKKVGESMNSKVIELLKQFEQLSKEEQAELIEMINNQQCSNNKKRPPCMDKR